MQGTLSGEGLRKGPTAVSLVVVVDVVSKQATCSLLCKNTEDLVMGVEKLPQNRSKTLSIF